MNITRWFLASFLLATVSFAQADAAPEISDTQEEMTAVERGQKLHDDANCWRCHGNYIYTRNNRRIRNYPRLKTQVQYCANQLDIAWWDEEIADVADYLEAEFYRF